MVAKTKQETDFIKMVANRLAESFMEPVFLLSKDKKSDSVRIGGLAEILDWSQEFYKEYNDKIINWKEFERSSNNIYHVDTIYGLIDAFGRERIKKFYDDNKNDGNYFIEKYLAIKS